MTRDHIETHKSWTIDIIRDLTFERGQVFAQEASASGHLCETTPGR